MQHSAELQENQGDEDMEGEDGGLRENTQMAGARNYRANNNKRDLDNVRFSRKRRMRDIESKLANQALPSNERQRLQAALAELQPTLEVLYFTTTVQ